MSFTTCSNTTKAPSPTPVRDVFRPQIHERLDSQDRLAEQLAKQVMEQQARYHIDLCEKLSEISSLCTVKSKVDRQPLSFEISGDQGTVFPLPSAPSESIKERKSHFIRELEGVKGTFDHLDITEPEDGVQHAASLALARMRNLLRSGWVDLISGVVIILNLCCMFAQFQWSGYATAYELGLREDDGNWREANAVFEIFEDLFNIFYFLEVLLKASLLFKSHFADPLNVIDAFVVMICVIENFVLKPLNVVQVPQLVYMRAVRTIRLFRTMKVLKVMKRFNNLRVLLKVLASTMDDLMWGMLLIFVIIVSCGMLLVTFVQPFINDDNADYARRKWAFERFGSSFRASYTLFEAAFTGTWVQSARPLILEVNEMFAVFWILYVCIVNFAISRVVGALFLKETMAVANADAESRAGEMLRRRQQFADKLHNIFAIADSSGDGCISVEEFKNMLTNEEVMDNFEQLELQMEDVSTLFLILSADDGSADYGEFLNGAMRLKAGAQHIDVITITHCVETIHKRMDQLNANFETLLRRSV